ncbi:hypothetical protein BC833DRAFT_568787, partial [Globomyces pollinis-pini]
RNPTLLQYGVSFKYKNDNGRQKLLNLLCFISIISMIPYYYTNQSREFNWLNDATLLIGNIGIQYGLVVLTHNSIVKLKVYFDYLPIFKHLHNSIYVMYFLPPLPLALIVLSMVDGQAKGTLARSSVYNTKYYKPFAIVAISLVNVFSIAADLLLMYKVMHLKDSLSYSDPKPKDILSHNAGQASQDKRPAVSKDKTNQPATISMNTFYRLVVLLIVIDMIGKVLVILDYPAFDSIVTLTSLALRSLANLKFGMKLKSHLSYQTSTDDKPTRKPTNTNTNVNVFQTMKTNPQSFMTANDRMAVLGSQR